MKNEVDWSAISSELKEAVEESNSCFPAAERLIAEMESQKQSRKRSIGRYLADKWIDLVALALAVIAFIRTL